MFSLYFLDTYTNIVKYVQRKDLFRNIKHEILLEVSKATFCRHMKKKGKLLFDKREIFYNKPSVCKKR